VSGFSEGTGTGVVGHSSQGTGVSGHSDGSGTGVEGTSEQGTGVSGTTQGNSAGVAGRNAGTGPGVSGNSAQGDGVSGFSEGTGTGVVGHSSQGTGVSGHSDGSGTGVEGASEQGTGVSGTSRQGTGMSGFSAEGTAVAGISAQGTGVYGRHTDGSPFASPRPGPTGVFGESAGTGTGVEGTSAAGAGIKGSSHDGIAVIGRSGHSESGGFGFGFAPNQAPGVMGTSFNGDGVHGFSLNGVGVRAAGASVGISATASGGLAGDFQGNVRVSGVLIKGGGGFKIDHPLDQANRYLTHSFVESPEMKNLYDGVVHLDDEGQATVELPTWFGALNEAFRYQLTPIGGPAPGLHVSRTLADNRFSIAGGEPAMDVCWQVTGVRRDAWALAHPIVVEEDKAPEEQGFYLHPQEHGQPTERDLASLRSSPLQPLPAE